MTTLAINTLMATELSEMNSDISRKWISCGISNVVKHKMSITSTYANQINEFNRKVLTNKNIGNRRDVLIYSIANQETMANVLKSLPFRIYDSIISHNYTHVSIATSETKKNRVTTLFFY